MSTIQNWSAGEVKYTGNHNQPPQLPLNFWRIFIPGNSMIFVTGEKAREHAETIAQIPQIIAAMKDLVSDVDAIGGGYALGTPGEDFWPDLLLTYNRVKTLLARCSVNPTQQLTDTEQPWNGTTARMQKGGTYGT